MSLMRSTCLRMRLAGRGFRADAGISKISDDRLMMLNGFSGQHNALREAADDREAFAGPFAQVELVEFAEAVADVLSSAKASRVNVREGGSSPAAGKKLPSLRAAAVAERAVR